MKQNKQIVFFFGVVSIALILLHWPTQAHLFNSLLISSTPQSISRIDSPIKYPIQDDNDPLNYKDAGLNLNDPSNVEPIVEYDPETKKYTIAEKIGNGFYKDPKYLSFEEYQKYEWERQKKMYWKQKAGITSAGVQKSIIPKIYVENEAFDRVFGSGSVDIRPQGSFELSFSGRFTNNQNPTASVRAQKQANFDFDEKIQMNVIGSVGDKLKITTNFNTESQFDFENQVKLDYTGYEDEIIKKIEAGNVSLPLSTSLISGSQALFGIKAQLQFGRLTVTSVMSQQKSEQKEIVINSGSQVNDFRLQADSYEANRHYFLSHYFRDSYNTALQDLPIVNSGIVINKIEVWITNKNNTTQDTRDIIAYLDLGENQNIYNTTQVTGGSAYSIIPNSDETQGLLPSNDLLRNIPASFRNSNDNEVNSYFVGGEDNFAKLTFARKLTDKEFSFSPNLGFISLNQALNADEVLAVAYRYTLNGVEYQVGEFSSDFPFDQNAPTVLYTKMLKDDVLKINLPNWDLMMKNIYNIGAYQLSADNFKLDVFRLDETTGVEKQVIAEGANTTGKRFLQLTQLDRINVRQEKQQDGVFDFIEGYTIDSRSGRVIFPVIEPFGTDLALQFQPSESELVKKYVFQKLYDTTQNGARQFPEQNKYFLRGTYQGTNGSEFSLNAINVPPNSVIVTAGTQVLVEGQDYTVDYNIGRVRIINEGILNSGQQIKIKLESNQLFAVQSKFFLGTRFDYKVNKKLNLGATVVRLNERPLTQKVNIGDEPVRNTMYGFDANYNSESLFLTKLVDKIPLINTKVPSTISLNGEYAKLNPGHSKALNIPGYNEGISYIDDFEGTKSLIDLRNPLSWFISGTPQLFPEAQLNDDLSYGFNRARLSHYSIDPLFYNRNNVSNPSHIKKDLEQLSNHYVRQVLITEVFQNKQLQNGTPNYLQTFDINYNPKIKGPYNFNTTGIDANGRLTNPNQSWGGIMRRIESTEFESLNVEFIEIWMLDPFIYNKNVSGGTMYIDLGNISEDILKDGQKMIENGLPADGDPSKVAYSNWGKYPKLQPVNQNFDNNSEARVLQDLGLDGLSTEEERAFFSAQYLEVIKNKFGESSKAYQDALADPSGDDYHYYRGADLDQIQAGIIDRYARVNLTESNSKTTEFSQQVTGIETTANTPNPDGEDYNRDNNMVRADEYFEYKLALVPDSFVVGKNFITDKVSATVTLDNKKTETVDWYQFKIPIAQYQKAVGGIQDFKSIRFVRMYLTDFSDSIQLRFARLQLVRSEWRRNLPQQNPITLGDSTLGPDNPNTQFEVTTVNFEENGFRTPIPYRIPPIVQRQRTPGFNGSIAQNEQSLSLRVIGLEDGFARSAYKNVFLDFRSYKELEMSIHAEGENLQDGDLTAFIRLGTDYNDNFYEYEIPLKMTPYGTDSDNLIWPEENRMVIPFIELQKAKQFRNNAQIPFNKVFELSSEGNKIYIKGQPDLSKVRVIQVGIRNPKDNGDVRTAEVWYNELRMTEFDEDGGWAALGRVNAKLADFADLTLSGSISTYGFGSIDKKVSERQRSENTQVDATASVELAKFIPEKAGLHIPLYMNYSSTVIKPQFSPESNDILTENALTIAEGQNQNLDSIKKVYYDISEKKGINITNLRKDKTGKSRPRIYDVSNLSLTTAYNQTIRTNYLTQYDSTINYRASLGYTFNSQPKNYRPLYRLIKSNSMTLLKDFNFNLRPYAYDFRIDLDRMYNTNKPRDLDKSDPIDTQESFNKSFRINRNFGFKWDFTRALKFDYTATNQSIVDEPLGRIEGEKKDTLLANLYSFGRTTNFNQNLSLGYAVPINKLPGLDFITLNTRYSAKFEWRADPLAAQQVNKVLPPDSVFGNTILNTRTITINPTISMSTLYNKSKYLKGLANKKPNSRPKRNTLPLVDGFQKFTQKNDSSQVEKNTKEKPDKNLLKGAGEAVVRFFIGIKTINGTYTRSQGTLLPGYLGKTTYFGLDQNFNWAPGIPFILGSQQDIKIPLASQDLISKDQRLNTQYVTNDKTDLNVRTNIEPIPDLRIELSANRSESFTYQSNFKYNPTFNRYDLQNAQTIGSYSMSFISIQTAFSKVDKKTSESEVFNKFESSRVLMSEILGQDNPNSLGDTSGTGFYDGYGKAQQDVLIPTFLSVYSGKSPSKGDKNYFLEVPLPNYTIRYSGLTRNPFIADIFSNITINHSYKSTYSVNSFQTLIRYREDASGNVVSRDLTGNFLPEFQTQQVTIAEQFSPFIGFDTRLKNNLGISLEYRKGRNLGLSVSNGQVSEQKDNGIRISFNYKTDNLKIPIKINKEQILLKNNVTFLCNITINDTRTIIHRVDVANGSETIGGNYVLNVQPSIDYVINQKLNLRLFVDRRLTKPYTSQSFKVSNTNIGFALRFTLGV